MGSLAGTEMMAKDELSGTINLPQNIGRVLLIGSCVTRDALAYVKTEAIDYYARTSFISLSSLPVKTPDVERLVSLGNFEKRMILSDFDKRLVEQLVTGRYDVVILDFIDERFDMALINGQYVTYSNYLIQSKLLDSLENFTICKRFSMDAQWAEACEIIVQKFKALGLPVILHKAWWAERFYNHTTGEVEVFDEEQLKIVRKYNALLSFYYEKNTSLYPEINIVEVESSLVYSDFAHKWGRDYFHYSQLYYRRLADLVSKVLR